MSIITKGLIGIEDLNIGAGTFTRSTSTGGTNTLTKINLASLGLGAGSGIITTFTVVSTTPVTATVATAMLVNATSGNITVNLPTAASALAGSIILVKKTDSTANTVNVVPSGADTIDGGSSFLLSLQNEFMQIVSDGVSKWWVIG